MELHIIAEELPEREYEAGWHGDTGVSEITPLSRLQHLSTLHLKSQMQLMHLPPSTSNLTRSACCLLMLFNMLAHHASVMICDCQRMYNVEARVQC